MPKCVLCRVMGDGRALTKLLTQIYSRALTCFDRTGSFVALTMAEAPSDLCRDPVPRTPCAEMSCKSHDWSN